MQPIKNHLFINQTKTKPSNKMYSVQDKKRIDLDKWQHDIFETTKQMINNLLPKLSNFSFSTYSLNEIYFQQEDLILECKKENLFEELKKKLIYFQNQPNCCYILMKHIYFFEKKYRRKYILVRWFVEKNFFFFLLFFVLKVT